MIYFNTKNQNKNINKNNGVQEILLAKRKQ
jgi:hypothetical protein